MFKSHLITMLIFSFIVSTMVAFIRYDQKNEIIKYGLKLFLYMTIGVIAFSWFMHFI